MITQVTTETSGIRRYHSAMSQDGRYIISARYGNSSLRSKDYGATWAATTGGYMAAMSASGQYQFLGGSTYVYRSTDYGETWSQVQPLGTIPNWQTVACGSTGQYVVVASASATAGRILMSTDYGATWAEIFPFGNYIHVYNTAAISADGQYIYVGAIDNTPRTKKSSDGGATWSDFSISVCNNLACSDNGEYVVYGRNSAALIFSNYGNTYLYDSPLTGGGQAFGVAISHDGSRMAVAMGTGRVWLSRNYGVSWEEVRPLGDTAFTWRSIALSDDGSRMYLGINDATSRPGFLAYDWNPGIMFHFLD